jgi:adenylate cyclase
LFFLRGDAPVLIKSAAAIGSKLRARLWPWRGIIVAAPTVTLVVFGLRWVGLLQFLELAWFDQFVRWQPVLPPDQRVVIVGISQTDLDTLAQPFPTDATLARLIRQIRAQDPAAIGLDIVRSLPLEPGYDELVKVYRSTPNLIGIRKAVRDGEDAPIAPPPVLAELGQVAASDVPMDVDGTARRGLLYVTAHDDEIVDGLGMKLASLYLQEQGITESETPAPHYYIQFQEVVIPALGPYSGGYTRLDNGGYQVLIRYHPHERDQLPFPLVSVVDVLEGRVEPDLFRDRIVLIGYTAHSHRDLTQTPYSRTLLQKLDSVPGVMVHGHLASQIVAAALGERAPLRSWPEWGEFLWLAAWTTLATVISWQGRYPQTVTRLSRRSIVFLLGAIAALALGSYGAFLTGWWLPLVPPLLGITGAALGIMGYLAYHTASLRSIFSRYVSDEIVAALLETPAGLNLGGQRQEVSILMSDLRGFSNISEQYSPEQVVALLNIYLEEMTDVINHYGGTINEFIGDAILVLFGAPTSKPDDAERAVACAIAMQLAMPRVNQRLQAVDLPAIQMGIGINTGSVVVGNIGSAKHAKWTVVGSHINLASRIESYTVGNQVLISWSTLTAVAPRLTLCQQREVCPKGFDTAVMIYDVTGIGAPYNLALPQQREPLILLRSPIPVQCTMIEDKDISDHEFKAEIVRISANAAQLHAEYVPELLCSLQLTFAPPFSPLYAKVTALDAPTHTIQVQFTVVPPRVEKFIQAAIQHSQAHL